MGVHGYLCVEGHWCPLCILRHFVSVVEVVAEGWLFMLVHQIRVGAVCFYGHCQQAVHYYICISVSKCKNAGNIHMQEEWITKKEAKKCTVMIKTCIFSVPPNWGGEVCIYGRGETIMVEVAVHAWTEIDRLHHAARGQDAQECVEIRKAIHFGDIKGIGECLGWIDSDVHILIRDESKKSLNEKLEHGFLYGVHKFGVWDRMWFGLWKWKQPHVRGTCSEGSK